MKFRRSHLTSSLLLALVGGAVAIAIYALDEKKGTRAVVETDQRAHEAAEKRETKHHARRLSSRVAQALDGEDGQRAGRIVGRFESLSGCEVLGAVSPRQADPGPAYGQVREFLLSTNDVGVALADESVVIVAVDC